MQQNALFSADRANGGNVLNHTNFVINEHHAGQNSVGPQRGTKHRQVQQPIRLNVEIGHLKALAFEFTAGVQHGFMLCFNRDQMFATIFVKVCRTLQRQVVGLCCARSPDDFAGIGIDQRSDLLARRFYRLFGLPTPSMATGCGIAKMITQPRQHGIHHTLVAWIGSAVIHINREMGSGFHD